MKFSLIVTTLNRGTEFERMINSLLDEGNLNYIDNIIILDQSENLIFERNTCILELISSKCKVFHKKIKQTSLSHARNMGLEINNNNNNNNNILCFPDDDCWYPKNFFKDINEIFENNNFDVVQTYYREQELDGKKPIELIIDRNNVKYLHPCSVGIFINLKNIDYNFIKFDEILSVGSLLPGGEESDLLFSFLSHNYKIKQISYPYVYHKVVRERLKKPSHKIHAARFYVMLKNKNLNGIRNRLIFSLLKSIVVLPFDHKNFFGKLYALRLWLKK